MTDQNTTSMSQPTGFAVGDRVRIVNEIGLFVSTKGRLGTIEHGPAGPQRGYSVRLDGGNNIVGALATDIEPHDPTEDLIAIAEQCGAVEFNRWIADGMLCRRFITPDGTIDLTVRVP